MMTLMRVCKAVLVMGAMSVLALGSALAQSADRTLVVVTASDLKIVDPIWTTALITRDHGYMVYDTLFAQDADGQIQPQMVDQWSVSEDQLTWSFTLRDGLLFHDGAPVTSDDVIASLKRWSARDNIGQMFGAQVSQWKTIDSRTFELTLREPFTLMLSALGKPGPMVPFIMPKRIAETSPSSQIKEYVGSGPYLFKQEEWQPGVRAVYARFEDYKPRSEPPSAMAGGKVVNVDRVEFRTMPDSQTAANALLRGEVDMLASPAADLMPILRADQNIKFTNVSPEGSFYIFRFNTLAKPFDDPAVRRVLFHAFNTEDFVKAVHGDTDYAKPCKSIFPCGTAYGRETGMEDKLNSNLRKAREMLEASSYDGTPIVLLDSSDVPSLINLGAVAKSLMERAGFTVDLQTMDWQSVVARRASKASPQAGGWHALITSVPSATASDPINSGWLRASCDKASPGWPCDSEIERLRAAFASATSDQERLKVVDALMLRNYEYPVFVPLGMYSIPAAHRASVQGLLSAPANIYWNVTKQP